jgi:hypothetical protein
MAPLVIGLVVVLFFALVGGVLYARSGERVGVLVVANPVAAGQVIQSSDLAVAHISPDASVRTIDANLRGDMVGKPAAVPLASGALLSPESVGQPSGLQQGETEIGLALKAGQLPPNLGSGDRVTIVGTDSATPSQLVGSARVTSVGEANDSTSDATVGVVIPASAITAVAAAAAEGKITLGLLPAESR